VRVLGSQRVLAEDVACRACPQRRARRTTASRPTSRQLIYSRALQVPRSTAWPQRPLTGHPETGGRVLVIRQHRPSRNHTDGLGEGCAVSAWPCPICLRQPNIWHSITIHP